MNLMRNNGVLFRPGKKLFGKRANHWWMWLILKQTVRDVNGSRYTVLFGGLIGRGAKAGIRFGVRHSVGLDLVREGTEQIIDAEAETRVVPGGVKLVANQPWFQSRVSKH